MPTIRQKLAVKKIVENHGNVSKAMREANYSPQTAKNPSNLIRSKGWQELMEEYLPDSKIAQVHAEAFEATRKVGEEEIPDWQTRMTAVKEGYKVKGKYPAEGNGTQGPQTLIINWMMPPNEPMQEVQSPTAE